MPVIDPTQERPALNPRSRLLRRAGAFVAALVLLGIAALGALLMTVESIGGAEPPEVQIEDPLAPTLSGGGQWYVGDAAVSEPACGSSTLYRDTPDGLQRGLRVGTEIDTVVDFDFAATQTSEHPSEAGEGRFVRSQRFIVLSTECPDEYDGRQLWIG